jgi:inner membrane protein
MDPVTHSLTGAVLSRAGLNRTTPLATATLVLAANAPDVDGLVMVQGTYASLALRRGLTHGPLAMLLLPLVVAGGILLYDRFWRRRRGRDVPAARPLAVLGLAALGGLTHPLLDWMNTYGIRLLMPFSDRWFYGDALFIIDPWIWLLLAAPVVGLAVSRRGRIGWVLLGIAATLLVMLAPQVPLAARVVWAVAVAALALHTAIAWRRRRPEEEVAAEAGGPEPAWARPRTAQAVLVAVTLYIGGMVAADHAARGAMERAARAEGLQVRTMMAAPLPANPFAAELVVETDEAYRLGTLDWFRSPRVEWTRSIPKGERTPAVLATLQLQEVRDFLRWSRFPYVEQQDGVDGYVVRFGDARYPAGMRGGLSGIVVHVEGSLRVRPME